MSETDAIKVDSIDQAEKIILEHVNNGKNYRDIAQITFDSLTRKSFLSCRARFKGSIPFTKITILFF